MVSETSPSLLRFFLLFSLVFVPLPALLLPFLPFFFLLLESDEKELGAGEIVVALVEATGAPVAGTGTAVEFDPGATVVDPGATVDPGAIVGGSEPPLEEDDFDFFLSFLDFIFFFELFFGPFFDLAPFLDFSALLDLSAFFSDFVFFEETDVGWADVDGADVDDAAVELLSIIKSVLLLDFELFLVFLLFLLFLRLRCATAPCRTDR